MSKLIQSSRLATLYTPLGEDVLSLRSLHATEQLGRLFTFELEVESEQDDIKADDLLGQPVVVEVNLPPGGERYFHGFVNCFTHSPRVGRRYFRYHLTVVPWLWMLTRQADCRIFQNKSVPDILRDVFGRRGFSAFEINLHGTYDPWEYCVQYRETDFNFVSRLMEQEGIYYYFKHTLDDHTLVLVDSPDAHQPFPSYEKVILRARAGTHGSEDELLREWRNEHRHHTGAFAQTDYDFTQPRVNLATQNHLPGEFVQSDHEVYDYPGEYVKYNQGEALAKVRMEEIRAERVVYHSAGNVAGLTTGYKFSLTGPTGFKHEGDYLVTGTSIYLKTANYATGGVDDDGEGDSFNVACALIPAAEPFRPARLTPKPVLQGVQTAVVTGPKGEEIYTDKYGRIKVQFHWDREGKFDENTTCFIRVGQVWAGKRWGATFIPRIGQEVIVAFLEGDPDQPIVVGSVYNGEQMPPYLGDGPDPKHKDDPKVSGIKSLSTKGGGGFNELRFDDNKGKEEVFLHAEKNFDTRVKSNALTSVGGDYYLTVGGEYDGRKSGDQFEMVFRNKHLKVHKDQVEHIGGNQKLLVGGIDGGVGRQDIHVGYRFMMVDKDDHLYVEGKRTQEIAGATSLDVGGDQQEKVGGNHALDAAKEIHLKGGTKVIIEAATQLTIKVGGNFVDIGPAGVTIVGTQVKINSGGAAGSGSGSSPGAVPRPDTANPTLPTVADDSKPGFLSSDGGPLPTPPPASPSKPPPKPKLHPLKTGLGADVDALAEKCPAFKQKLQDLQKKGWKFTYGPAGGGTKADRDHTTVIIDSNEKGNVNAVTQSLAHESGHAGYNLPPEVPMTGRTKQQYVDANTNQNLKDEGEATLTNIEMRDCIKANGGSDIGVAGTQGPKYEAVAKKYPNPADRDKARQEIGDIYADGEHISGTPPTPSYRDHYGDFWAKKYDKAHPPHH